LSSSIIVVLSSPQKKGPLSPEEYHNPFFLIFSRGWRGQEFHQFRFLSVIDPKIGCHSGLDPESSDFSAPGLLRRLTGASGFA
jgi:hypothetical protein